jgi:predicted HTH domain antitoxin
MTITVDIPDELARQILREDEDPSRQVLEDVVLEAYRAHRLTEHQLATVLGLDRYALDGFLKSREIWLEYSADDLDRERNLGLQLLQRRQGERGVS